jgi:cytochrome c-type biogenesis protein CcmH
VWLEYAEALGLQQGGTLVGEPAQLVAKALALAPDDPKALDLAGSAAWEQRDFKQAALHWRRLLLQLPPGSERHQPLADAISRVEQHARLAPPPSR